MESSIKVNLHYTNAWLGSTLHPFLRFFGLFRCFSIKVKKIDLSSLGVFIVCHHFTVSVRYNKCKIIFCYQIKFYPQTLFMKATAVRRCRAQLWPLGRLGAAMTLVRSAVPWSWCGCGLEGLPRRLCRLLVGEFWSCRSAWRARSRCDWRRCRSLREKSKKLQCSVVFKGVC